MAAAPSTAKDGFDQAFGLLSPDIRGDGSGAVAKQGWMCCFSGQYYLHSAGAVGPEKRFLVVLLTRQPRTKGWPAARTEHDRDRDAGGRGTGLTPPTHVRWADAAARQGGDPQVA